MDASDISYGGMMLEAIELKEKLEEAVFDMYELGGNPGILQIYPSMWPYLSAAYEGTVRHEGNDKYIPVGPVEMRVDIDYTCPADNFYIRPAHYKPFVVTELEGE